MRVRSKVLLVLWLLETEIDSVLLGAHCLLSQEICLMLGRDDEFMLFLEISKSAFEVLSYSFDCVWRWRKKRFFSSADVLGLKLHWINSTMREKHLCPGFPWLKAGFPSLWILSLLVCTNAFFREIVGAAGFLLRFWLLRVKSARWRASRRGDELATGYQLSHRETMSVTSESVSLL